MEEFMFDLQRFATTWTLTSATENNTTKYTLTSGTKTITSSKLTDLLTVTGKNGDTADSSVKVAAGDTIQLGGDIKVAKFNNGETEAWSITKDITLNLNGHNIDGSEVTTATGGTGTINDTSEKSLIAVDSGVTLTLKGKGEITAGGSGFTIRLSKATGSGAKLIMDGVTIKNTTARGVQLLGGSTFTMNSGTIEAYSGVLLGINDGGSSSATYKNKKDTFIMNGGTIDALTTQGVLLLNGGEVFEMNGGTIICEKHNAVANNGQAYNDPTTITINKGTITGKNIGSTAPKDATLGIYHAGVGKLTINGGEIEGEEGIEVRAGTANINGGKITGTGTPVGGAANGNGSTMLGAAISIPQHTTKQDITVNIAGGTLSGYNAVSVTNPESNTDGTLKLNISGGTLTSTNYNKNNNEATSVKGENKNFTVEGGDVLYIADNRVTPKITGGKFTGNLTVYDVGGATATTASTIKLGDYTVAVLGQSSGATADAKNLSIITGTLATGDTANKSTGTFTVDTAGNPTGFIFAEATKGHKIVLPSGFDTNSFKLYDVDTKTEIDIPEIGATKGALVIGQDSETAGQYFVIVDKNASTVKLADTTIDISKLAKNDYAKITFNADGFVSVIPINGATVTDVVTAAQNTTTVERFLEGSAITVTGDVATGSDEGIAFVTETNRISTASGNYTFTTNASTDTYPTVLTLNEATDTIYSTGGATKVVLGGKEGTITDADENAYKYVSGGKAYFTATSSAINGFVFASENDAITQPAETPLTTLSFMPYGNNVTAPTPLATTALPTVTNTDEYTITMVVAPTRNATDAATFEMSGLGEGATATVSEAAFEFSAADGAVRFDQTGAAQGFTAASGTVTMNDTAAGLLDTLVDDKATFTINGTPVNITAGTTLLNSALVYNMDDNGKESLLGLGSGTTIVDAGTVTKIYTSNEEGATYTFGDENSAVEFTTTAQGSDADDLAYFTVDGSKATGFTFIQRDDAITLPEEMSEGFKLYDTAEDTEGFLAPVVTDAESGDNASITVAKTVNSDNTECFEITSGDGLDGKKIAFTDGANLTFTAAETDTAVFFSKEGKLLNIEGLTGDDNEVSVEGATEAIKIDASEIEITGGGFTYRIQEGGAPSIVNLVADSKVVKAAGVEQLWTISDDTKGNGEFTFGASSVYTIEGLKAAEDPDGIRFDYDGEKVTGISSVEGNASVTGALAELQTINGIEFKVTPATEGTSYTFSGTAFAGLLDGDKVDTASSITDFITAGASGKYTMVDKAFEVAGEKDGVTFKFTDGSFSAIEGLDTGATVKGDFTNVTVNEDKIDIVGDEEIYLVGGEEGIAKIGGLSGDDVTISETGNATVLGMNGDGKFTLAIEYIPDGFVYEIADNGEIETTFTYDNGAHKIDGMDVGEKFTASFAQEISVEGQAIQVIGDDQITVVNGASGISIEGLTGGASIAKADGKITAVTDGEGTFTFADGRKIELTGSNATFEMEDGVLKGINDLDESATVVGDLNGVIINGQEPDIKVVHSDGSDNTDLTYEAGVLTGLVNGDTVIRADNVSVIRNVEEGTFTFGEGGQEFTVEGDSAVDFMVNAGEVAVNAIAALDAGATLRGDIGSVSSINGASFEVTDENGFAVVGAETGISQIVELSDGAIVNNAGGASRAITDSDGTFTFAGGQSFSTLFDNQFTFELDADSKVTAINDFSGSVRGELSEIAVNGKSFDIQGDTDDVFTISGKSDASGISLIGNVGGSAVTINSTGGASTLITNEVGKYTFASGQEFETDDDILFYTLNGDTVTKIEALAKSITGNFNEIQSVNGASFAVIDNDGILTIVGNESVSGINAIAGVNGDAQIENVGGAAEIVTASDGAFTFAGHSNPFVIAGDSSVTFNMDTAQPAKVLGIANFGDQVPATVSGELADVELVGVGNIKVTGDADGILSYAIDADGTKTLGEVGGDDVTLTEFAGASSVEVVQSGKYAFPNQSYELGADSATFVLNGDNVTAIDKLDGQVMGDFRNDGFTVNGKKVQIAGDSTIIAFGSANGVEMLGRLCDGAQIVEAEGVTVATTASDGTFTFADDRQITIAGDSQVNFQLDGRGNLVAIGDLDPNATISGDLNGLTFVEGGASIDVRDAGGKKVNLWYSNGTLSSIVPADTIISADGATMVAAAGNGLYVFGEGENAQTFDVQGDQGIIGFRVVDGNKVTAVTELDPDATILGALNGLTINNGAALDVVGDTSYGAVAATEGLAALTGLGGESSAVTVNEADGAKRFETITDGIYTLLQNDPYSVGGDSNGVVFGLNSDNKVSSVDDVNGYVLGSFTDTVAVNNEDIQVTSDTDGVFVYGDGAKVTALADVNAGSNVAAWGSASKVSTKGAGEFAFSTVQNFIIGTDSSVTFVTGASGVTGIDDITSSTITFDANRTNALEVNAGINDPLTNIASETLVTLTTDENGVLTAIDGVTGSISGVQNATVAATGPITVNGKEFDITDADSKFNVVAQNGVTKATAVTGDATVNVASAAVETDELGNFVIGGDSFKFSDDDGNVNFTTDADKKLTAVDLLNGTMEINGVSSAGVYVGSNLVAYYGDDPTTPVTITAANDSLVAIDGLEDGSTIGGDLGGAIIAMEGTSSSILPAELTVNDDAYKLYNDADGVNIIPATTSYTGVAGLGNDASLSVVPGTYVVNGQVLEVEDGDVIIGAEDGTFAYIYDPQTVRINKNTPVEVIEEALGLPAYTEEFGTEDNPLDSGGVSSVLAEDLDRPMEIYATNETGSPQNLDFSNNRFTKKVHLFEGPQNLAFNDEGKNLAIVERNGKGRKGIDLGNGGDTAIIDMDRATGNYVDIVGGAGNDNIVVRGSAEVSFDMSNGGLDIIATFASAQARIHLGNYDASTGSGIRIDETRARDLAAAIASGFVSFGDGVLQIGTGANVSRVSFDGQTGAVGAMLVNLFNNFGMKQAVGFTNSGGGELDCSSSNEDLILIGNQNGDKSGGSVLRGGSGNDKAYAGGGDVVDLGDGINEVTMHDDVNRNGADITVRQGQTTIRNFNTTFSMQHGDVLHADLSTANVFYNGKDVIIENANGSYGVIADAKPRGAISYDLATSADEASPDLVSDNNYVNMLFNEGSGVIKTAIGAEGSVMQVEVDEDQRAERYLGNNSGLTFAGYTGNVVVDLSKEWTSHIDGREAVFDGINSVKAGAAGSYDQIKGSADNETLLAGQGYASLYGANGNNVLYGYNSDAHSDKEGYATFFVLGQSDGAANVIKDFEFVDDDNYKDTQKVTADMVEILVQDSRVLDAYLSGNDVVIDVINNTNGVTESAVIEGAKGKDFRVTENVVAQVNDTTLKFDKYANYYYATGKNATVTVDTTLDEANVWLGTDSQLKKDFFGDIAVLDATGFTGKANLVGTNWRDNTIIAGSGETSLWGGASNYNDVMQGGAGKDTFFYAYGNGNDTVNGAGNGDVVNLAVSLDQLYTEIGSDSVVLNFTDGGKLTVNDGGADVSYVVQGDNNATYKVDRTNNTWIRKG